MKGGTDNAGARSLPGARLLLAAVLVSTFAVHLLVVAEPFGRDQGIFAYIGDALLDGAVPYRDAWDHKTPGLYGVYALAFALFGRAMSSVHVLEGLALVLGALFLYGVGAKVRNTATGLLAALLYGIAATLLFEWWDRGQAEIYMGLTGTGAVSFFLDWQQTGTARRRGALDLLLAGVFCGLTVLFKPSGVLLAAGLALCTVLVPGHGRRVPQPQCLSVITRMVRATALLALGFALPLLTLALYYAANSALDDLYQTVIVFNTYHARIGGNPTLAGTVSGTLDFLASMNVLSPLALVGLVLALARTRQPATWVAVLWLAVSAAGVWTQGKFFSYHWSAVLPPLALFAAQGLIAVVKEARIQKGWVRLADVACCLVIGVVYGVGLATDHAAKWGRNLSYLSGGMTRADYLAHFGHNIQGRDIYSFADTERAAEYLRARTADGDYVLTWGFQALLNWLADRPSPTRYIFNYPLTFDRPESVFRVEARRRFLRDLRARPPAYIVLVTNDVNPLQAVDSYGLLPSFPELQSILKEHYRWEADIGEFHLFRRIDA